MNVSRELNSAPFKGRVAVSAGKQLERAFLAEMLKYAGPKASEGSFSGGIGEGQFASFLTESYADRLSESLDLKLFNTLSKVAA